MEHDVLERGAMQKAKHWIVLVSLLAAACSVTGQGEPNADSQVSDLGSATVVWFGDVEVREGHLKSSNGALPQAGTDVTLRLFLQQLSYFMCREYCAATTPHVFVRFDGTSGFTEIPSVPRGYVPSSGGVLWDAGNEWEYHYDAPLKIPAGSDRIETYVYWDRVSYSCVLESDETCTVNGPIDGAYLSNYGRNFRIAVTP